MGYRPMDKFFDLLAVIDKYGLSVAERGLEIVMILVLAYAMRCLLRSEMLRIYYDCEPRAEIRQYQLQNFLRMYRAYKVLLGNSFVDEIKDKVVTWRVVT